MFVNLLLYTYHTYYKLKNKIIKIEISYIALKISERDRINWRVGHSSHFAHLNAG